MRNDLHLSLCACVGVAGARGRNRVNGNGRSSKFGRKELRGRTRK